MNFMSLKKFDMNNGNGNRVSLFVSGCSHQCKGCFNEESWRYNAGSLFTEDVMTLLLEHLSQDTIAGLSVLGGEPLAPKNIKTVIEICERVRKEFPERNIWLWSGYTMAQINENPEQAVILSLIDVLVDGKFVEELKNPLLKHRGSSNQVVHSITNRIPVKSLN